MKPSAYQSHERLDKVDTFDEATACVSDLENVKDELYEIQKRGHISAIPKLQKVDRLLEEAIETLMHIDNH